MNCTTGQILHTHFLEIAQERCPDYLAVTDMAINTTINASINKAQFGVLYAKISPLSIDLLLPRETSISPYAHTFARKMKS